MSSGRGIRLMLTVHYDGSDFYGWQVQPEQRTVQGELHTAVERLTGEYQRITGAGRTDRGVHATGQVASLEVPSRWSPGEFRRAMNAVLPGDVWLAEVQRVPHSFHPRYHARARTYEYRVGLSPEAWSPFSRPWCWPVEEPVDRSLLEETSSDLAGTHSFQAFAKSGQEGRGHRCTVMETCWQEWKLGLEFVITADRYLHHMVRYLVGTMIDIGRGRREPGELRRLLEEGDEELVTSPPAPPEGLFLSRIEYPREAMNTTDDDRST